MINISSRAPGWVMKLPVDEGASVNKGDLLVGIDNRDVRLQLQQAEASLKALEAQYDRKQAEIALTRQQVETAIATARANLAAARSGMREASVTLTQSARDLARAKSLLSRKMISDETFDNTRATRDKAVQAHDRAVAVANSAKSALAAAQANQGKMAVLDNELTMIARNEDETRVEVNRLKTNLSDFEIDSPISGVIDEKFINAGEYVYPGQRILMLHDPSDVWISANIKETEVRRVRVGSPATVSVDAYPGKTWRGKVSYVGSATTSQFAMLPAPNPSGNFTKITQRLQIKVRLDDPDPVLKPGMMVELKIASD